MPAPIVVSGALAQKSLQGGLACFYLQFLLGFQRLGWEVLFLDRLEPEMCADEQGRSCSFADSVNRQAFLQIVRDYGLEQSFHLSYNDGQETIGVSRQEVLNRVRAAPFLLNIMGYLKDAEVLAQAARRVFLDIDPGFPQMWRELGLHDALSGYDAFVTLGRNIGQPACAIPTCGLQWLTMPQPVVMEQWPVREGGNRFTSIGAWRGPNAPVEYRGRTYGLRVHEFRQFFTLPRHCSAAFEMALEIHPNDARDFELLRSNGWAIVDPLHVARSPADYREYIGQSRAELMIPKQMYVATHSGLLSDRSAYYLASGKPVLARDTGLGEHYPLGTGLVTFATLEEAIAGVEEVQGNYARHAGRAREIAEAHFDSDHVLSTLLSDLGVT